MRVNKLHGRLTIDIFKLLQGRDCRAGIEDEHDFLVLGGCIRFSWAVLFAENTVRWWDPHGKIIDHGKHRGK